MNISVIGLPGAGKGTQSKKLADQFNLAHISVGYIFRENRSYVTKTGKEIGNIVDSGQEVSPRTTAHILSQYLEDLDLDKQSGLVLDGYPRTKKHALEAKKLLDINIVLVINISEETLFNRLTKRRVCIECDSRYHLDFNPPKKHQRCDHCGSELIQREDDTRDGIKARLSWQKDGITKVVDHYQDGSTVIHVDGDQSIDEVFEDIKSKISESDVDLPSA